MTPKVFSSYLVLCLRRTQGILVVGYLDSLLLREQSAFTPEIQCESNSADC